MHKYVITKSELTSRNVVLLTLKPEGQNDVFPYFAGQYVTVGWKNGPRPTPVRCFSIVTSPTEHGYLQLAMNIQGDFSYTASTLAVGTELSLQGPYGDLHFEPNASGHVMVAGGVAITAVICMLRYAIDTGVKQPLTLLYSCRTQDDVSFLPYLDELVRRNPRLAVVFAITSGPVDKLQGRQVIQRRIDRNLLLKAAQRQGPGAAFYICGPPGFMTAMTDLVNDLGVTDTYVHTGVGNQYRLKGHAKLYLSIFSLTALAVLGGVGLFSLKQLLSNLINGGQTPAPTTQVVPSGTGSPGNTVAPAATPTPEPYYQPRTTVS